MFRGYVTSTILRTEPATGRYFNSRTFSIMSLEWARVGTIVSQSLTCQVLKQICWVHTGLFTFWSGWEKSTYLDHQTNDKHHRNAGHDVRVILNEKLMTEYTRTFGRFPRFDRHFVHWSSFLQFKVEADASWCELRRSPAPKCPASKYANSTLRGEKNRCCVPL